MGCFEDQYSLRSVADLPAPFRSTFNFRYFNSLQSECFPLCFLSNINMVISAPTGSGKTVLFELCILRLLSRFLSQEGKFNHIKGILKTIYIAPSKALVQEKLRDWSMKLGPWGINCLEMTGDNEFHNFKNIQEADVILTTPEKFDAVTRHSVKDGGLSFFSDIALVLIDEVHLLNDPRGAALEAMISRIKMLSRISDMSSTPLANVRFIAVSATIPNIEDLAEWLLVTPQGIKRFGEEMRPVQLTTKVLGYAPARNDFLFERRLQNFIFDILMQHSRGKSALIFCSTRKGAQEAAECLSKTAMNLGYSNPFIKSKQQQEKLKEASVAFSDKIIQSCILNGVGYHNGGLCLKDRNLIEGLFLNGDLQILCTTNTLAHGINLPAHTVVIKSTQYFNKEKGLYLEYERSMILQMCGRAGRPPFDDTGTVIIMTRRETVHLYENLLNGCEMVESQLLSCAIEHLNAEIVQLTVSDISLAIEWLKCSYLYVRIKKNPENYGIKRGIPCECLEKHMRDICVQKINELSEYGMIWIDVDGFLLKPSDPGKLMTKFYLKFDTMKLIVKAPESCSLEDVLHIICHSAEIAWIQLRRNEKKLLNDIHSDKEGRLRFHVLGENGKWKKRIQTREDKIFVLANDSLTGDPRVHDLSLSQDASSICSNGSRIAKCMKEYFIYKKSYKGAVSSMLLAKCLHQRLWDNSPYLLKQLTGIGMVTAKALCTAGIDSFESMAEADPRKIELVTGRKYPFGNHIKESLLSLPPKIEIKIEEAECKRQGKSKLIIMLARLPQQVSPRKHHYADMVVGSEEDNVILFHEKIRAEEFSRILLGQITLGYNFSSGTTYELNCNCCFPFCLGYSESGMELWLYVMTDDQVLKLVHLELVYCNLEQLLQSRFNVQDSANQSLGHKGPYSVTVFVSCPQDGRVTVKADLVFEDFVGLDVHRKHVLSREVRSRMTQSNGNELYAPSYSLPKEIHIIDDDRNTKSKVITDAQDLGETNETLSSAPSFNLLQEEIGEDVFIPEAGETECKSKTEERIFDRIRKKSKSFPTLLSSKAMASSYQPLILKRKCPQENHFELDQSDVHVDDVVLIEEECNETSLKFRGAVETVEQDDGRFSGISNILYDGLRGNRFGQSDTSKLYDNLVNYIQAVRCKTAFPIESDPIPDRQDCHDQKEAPFCGFTSVFSFL